MNWQNPTRQAGRRTRRPIMILSLAGCTVFASSLGLSTPCDATGNPKAAGRSPDGDPVQAGEIARIEMIDRVMPSVVCMYSEGKRSGGSGVLIDEDGYGLTNFHVVAGMLATRKGWGGLGDGGLYELQVLGVDPTGDVAMFRLSAPGKLPFARLGDSDRVRLGDPVIAMGNPFSLSEDHSPTVTMGMVTGLNRYQHGSGNNLTYSDCIQTDAAINPGNSGGPLFNLNGEIIGINGRISVNQRGRLNVGLGYAISANQIRRFIPSLRAGLVARHGTLFATLQSSEKEGVVFDKISPDSPLTMEEIGKGDRLIAFDGIPIHSVNHYVSLLGTYPEHWPVELNLERDDASWSAFVRLAPVEPDFTQPFVVDRAVNLGEVKRVLTAFRRATLGRAKPDKGDSEAVTWRCNVMRRGDTGEVVAGEAAHYDFVYETGEPIRMMRRGGDASIYSTIEFDEEYSVERIHEDGEVLPMDLDRHMVQAALFVLIDRLSCSVDSLNLDDAWHVGGDARIDPSAASMVGLAPELIRGEQPEESGPSPLRPPFEVIRWLMSGQIEARFSFDPLTGRCRRIRIHDLLRGAVATVEMSNHRTVGGRDWPTRVEVRGPAIQYFDEFLPPEAEP